MNNKQIKKDINKDIFFIFNELNINNSDLISLINDLSYFNSQLKLLKDIVLFLNFENVNKLKNLRLKENIKINLILLKIYNNIVNNDSLYSKFLIYIEEDEDKTNLLLTFIEECIFLIEKLNGFSFSLELFKLKINVLSLIKCIFFNCGKKLSKRNFKKIQNFLDNIPFKFFSKAFNKLNKNKEIYEIWKSKEKEKIQIFQKYFSRINNYYEQLKVFQTFVENNLQMENLASVSVSSTIDDNSLFEKKENEIDLNKIDFYQEFGLLILNFCKYHKYIFLSKDNKEFEEKEKSENEESEKEEEEKEEETNERLIFLFDNIKIEEEGSEKEETTIEKNRKKLEKFIDRKIFVSVAESKEYNELIEKIIEFYIDYTEPIKNDSKIEKIILQMNDFLETLHKVIFAPLYIKTIKNLDIKDYFTPSFSINVSEGKKYELYLETNNETMLINFEFSLENNSKDINLEVNKYEIKENKFKQIFREEKIEGIFKFFIVCKEYSIYQIIFDNYYSWFTSKDINYKISMLKLIDNNNLIPNQNFKFEENIIKLGDNKVYDNIIKTNNNIQHFLSESNIEKYNMKIDKTNHFNIKNSLENLALQLANSMPEYLLKNNGNSTGSKTDENNIVDIIGKKNNYSKDLKDNNKENNEGESILTPNELLSNSMKIEAKVETPK